MDVDVKKLLEENLKVAKANHKLLKAMRRHQTIASTLKLLYWLVILVVIFGGYLYILKPLLGQLTSAYESIGVSIDGVQNITESVSDTGENVSSFFGSIFGKNKE